MVRSSRERWTRLFNHNALKQRFAYTDREKYHCKFIDYNKGNQGNEHHKPIKVIFGQNLYIGENKRNDKFEKCVLPGG